MKFFAALAVCLVVGSLGCTEKAKSHSPHEPAKPESQSPWTSHSDNNDETSPPPSPQATADLNALADKVLSRERISNPKSQVDRNVSEELAELNTRILQLKDSDRARPEFVKIRDAYIKALIVDCGAFRDSCTGLRYFKRANNSSAVVQKLAKDVADGRVRLLLIAFELKNRLWDNELVDQLLFVASHKVSNSEQADLDRAKSLINVAFSTAAERIKQREDARNFLDRMTGWDLLSNNVLKLDTGARSAVFELAARAEYLRDDKGQPHPGLKPLLNAMKNHSDGVIAKQDRLKKQNLFLPEASGARDIGQYNELTYLMDSVYTGEISAQSAAVLAQQLKLSSAQIREAVENYVRIQFLAASHESTQEVGRIFRAQIEVEGLLRYVIRNSPGVRKIWQAFLSQTLPLKSFAIMATTNGDPADNKKLGSLFDSLPKAISQSAVYPHVMVLFYMLSQKRFTVHLPFNGMSVDSAKLMNWLFEGKIPVLLAYTDDESIFNYFDLLHAFDMGVRTGVFETAGVSPDSIIAEIVRRLAEQSTMSDDRVHNLDFVVNRARTRLTETTTMREFRDLCEEIRGGIKKPRYFYFTDIYDSAYLGELRELIFNPVTAGGSDTKQGVLGAGDIRRDRLGLNILDNELADMIEKARIDLGAVRRTGEAMLTSYRDYLTRFKLPRQGLSGPALTAELDKLTAKSRTAIDEVQNKRISTLDFAVEMYKEFGTCYPKVALLERDMTDTVLEYEQKYLRHVHALLTKARQLPESERAPLFNSLKFSGLPSDFKGLDRLTVDGLFSYQVDLLIRVSRYWSHGLHVGTINLPALAPHLNISYGQRLDNDSLALRNSESGFIPYNENPDEFVASALRLYFRGESKSYFFWQPSSPLLQTVDWMKNLVSLYRLDYELTGQSKRITSKGILDMFEDMMSYARLSPRERNVMQLSQRFKKYSRGTFAQIWLRTDPAYEVAIETYGLYDLPLTLMAEEQLGNAWNLKDIPPEPQMAGVHAAAPVRQTVFAGGENYYKMRSPEQRSNLAIPYNPVLDQQLDKSFTHFVKSEIKAVHDFQEYTMGRIRRLKNLPADQRPYIDFDLSNSLREPLYSESAVQNFRTYEEKFHRNTGGFFK